MPNYEYRCRECGDEFEERVRFDTPVETIVCPGCGARAADRQMSLFAARVSSRALSPCGKRVGEGGCGGGEGSCESKPRG